MPRTPQQNQLLRAERKRRLLAAALTTFVRLGYDHATVRDIAQEAGVAQGLLYSYFRSKDDLLREVFHEGARDVAEAFGAGAAGSTPEERLERVIRRSLEIVRERREFWQLSYMLRHQPRTAELLGGELTAWTAAVRDQLATLLREIGHRNAPALARVLFGAIDGVAQHYVLAPDEYPLATTATCLVRHFCQRP
jgi:AcrR family transcriptional regulator